MSTSTDLVTPSEALDSLDLAHRIVDLISDIKGEDILILDLQEVTQIANYFVICNGNSDRQIRAIADKIQVDLKEKQIAKPFRVDGDAQSGWVLMDYSDVVVHIFSPEQRLYYNLEGFWNTAKTILRMK